MANPNILHSEARMSVANTRKIRFVRRASSYRRVTFDNPPLNIFGPETIPELNEIVTALENRRRRKGRGLRQRRRGLLPDALQSSRQARRNNGFATRSDGLVADSRHAGAPQPRSSCLDRLNPRACDRRRKRTCACERYALCESRNGHPVSVGSWC